jgi:hypothetical protein
MPSLRAAGQLTAAPLRLLRRPAIATPEDAVLWGQGWRLHKRTRLLSRSRRATLEWQRANAEHFERSLEAMYRFKNQMGPLGTLWGQVLRPDGSSMDLGLMSCRVVTDAGVQFLVDTLQNLTEAEAMRYHGIGTGSTAESAGQTALVTELTTQYSPANTRATGSQGEQAGNANVYETIGTNTVGSSVAITEHGIFSQAATGGGVLLDRSVFSAVNLVASESLATTYRLTLPSGG